MRVAADDWTSTPGSKIGGGGQRSTRQWLGYYNQALLANGKAVTNSNPLPVTLATGGRATLEAAGGYSKDVLDWLYGGGGGTAKPTKRQPSFSTSVDFDPASLQVLKNPEIPKVALKVYEDLAPAVAELNYQLVPLDAAMKQWASTTAVTALGMPPLTEAEKRVGDAGIDLKESLKQLEAQFGFVGIAGEDLIGKLAGAVGQAAGFLPQQQVGKKRGLFSKILGFAAPFLSFIPGFGPIASQIAGMASNALAGNWSGVASGLAGGLQPGGVFRSSGGGGASTTTWGNIHLTPPGRAAGGPVRRGRGYIVGEERPELFVPNSDGWIHPRVGARSGGADAVTTQLVAALDRHNAALERQNTILGRLEGVRPHDIVRMGARGYIDAMDQDAGLIRLSAQRHRLP